MTRRWIEPANHVDHYRKLARCLGIKPPYTVQAAIDALIEQLPVIWYRYAKRHDTQFVALAKASKRYILPMQDFRQALNAEPFRQELWLDAERSEWVKENVALITKLTDAHREQCQQIMMQEGSEDPQAIKAALIERLGMSKRRAKKIAVDQTLKVNAQLTAKRAADLGVNSYIWRSSNDSRVRPEHREYNGTIRYFGEGLEPGKDILCRCHAELRFIDIPEISLGS